MQVYLWGLPVDGESDNANGIKEEVECCGHTRNAGCRITVTFPCSDVAHGSLDDAHCGYDDAGRQAWIASGWLTRSAVR